TGCTAFNALYGLRQPGDSEQEQADLAVENLAIAAQAVAPIGGTVLLEPVSGADGYPLKTAADALDLIDPVQSSYAKAGAAQNLALLSAFDHTAVTGDDVSQLIEDHAKISGHIQTADNHGRAAPGSRELPLLKWIDLARQLGYTGKLALEYKQDQNSPFA